MNNGSPSRYFVKRAVQKKFAKYSPENISDRVLFK